MQYYTILREKAESAVDQYRYIGEKSATKGERICKIWHGR